MTTRHDMPRRDKVLEAAYRVSEERGGTLEERKEYFALCLREWDELETFSKARTS